MPKFISIKKSPKMDATRKAELENDPKQLLGAKGIDKSMTIGQAIDRYISELGAEFERPKTQALKLLKKFPIAKIPITALSPLDVADHANLRKNGVPELALDPITPATLGWEFTYLLGC